MPYNWAEFLDLARFLQGGAGEGYTDQAALRSAVGRAYYAAFNFACVHAEKNLSFSRKRTAEDHLLLRQLLQSRGKGNVASLLDELRLWRNTCDYDDTKPIRLIMGLVKPSIEKAQELIDILREN
jgi:uncharacterized protein (UPF0332 family)